MLKTLIVTALLLHAVTASALYKCTENGKILYQPSPCAGMPDTEPLDLKQPPEELQIKMRRQQLERNAEIAKQDLENAKRQAEIDRLNFWKRLEQDRIDSNNRYQQRMQQIEAESQQRQFETNCAMGSRSDECTKWRWEKRFQH